MPKCVLWDQIDCVGGSPVRSTEINKNLGETKIWQFYRNISFVSYILTVFRRDVTQAGKNLKKWREKNKETLLPVRQWDVMIIDGESHVFLKVFQTLRYEMFYPQWQFQLVDLFLVSEVRKDAGTTSVLQRLEVSFEDPERHLSFSRGAADYREQRFFYVLKTGESHAQGHTVLVVGEGPWYPVEVEADGGGDVLSECLNVLFMPASVPQEALVTQSPAVLVLPQHVDEGVHVEPGLLGADPEHHAGPEYPLGDVDLPVVSAAIEDPGAPAQ